MSKWTVARFEADYDYSDIGIYRDGVLLTEASDIYEPEMEWLIGMITGEKVETVTVDPHEDEHGTMFAFPEILL